MADMLQVLREFGFPTFVVLWFMWRFEKLISEVLLEIRALRRDATAMARTLDVEESK